MQVQSFVKNVIIILSHIVKEIVFKYKWYRWDNEPFNITSVAVVDGRLYSGGLTDRFKGIVSLYAWSKSKKIPFRIEYTYPFSITDYLIPNKYDWTINDGDYVKTIHSADIIYAVGEQTVIKRMTNKGIVRQVHFYGNRDLLETMNIPSNKWGQYFNELFRPTDRLNNTIKEIKENIGENYFSAVFRFQNLLGDFQEYDFKPLESESRRENLIRTCLNKINELLSLEMDKSCLVTSDSSTFLEEASKLKGVHIIPGELVHLGSNANGSYYQYEKSFIDFYMLSESSKIYSVVCENMYPSEFPLYAAKVNNIPFERIIIK